MTKDPLVLEFLGFEEHHRYSETDLETAIIDKLEQEETVAHNKLNDSEKQEKAKI